MDDLGVAAVTKAAGSKSNLARLLGISRGAVCQWPRIPGARVIAIESATGIPRHVQRPDLYPLPKCRRDPKKPYRPASNGLGAASRRANA
jgi:DNA-binding transcriptional regulator YdaS (Cro superfamily)